MFEIATFVVTAGGLVVGLTVLLTREAEWSTFWQTVLSVAEITVLVVSFVLFGWWGLILATVVLVVALVVWIVRLYARWEAGLVAAIARGRLDMTKDEVKAFARHLRESDRALRAIRPTGLTNLIRVLSESGRDANDIEVMAPALGRIWIIYDYHKDEEAQERITSKFDQCLRLWGKDPSDAEDVADKLVAATKQSATSFEEMLDGMIAFAHP